MQNIEINITKKLAKKLNVIINKKGYEMTNLKEIKRLLKKFNIPYIKTKKKNGHYQVFTKNKVGEICMNQGKSYTEIYHWLLVGIEKDKKRLEMKKEKEEDLKGKEDFDKKE